MTHPYQRNRILRHQLPSAHVSEHGNIRSLHLGTATIQSSMNMDCPSELVLSYSRTMMAWLLFCRQLPEHVLHIGLGGGSFVRWLDEYCPNMRQTAVEINPQVIAIARMAFELPFEDEQFEIILADGAEYIKTVLSGTDLILVDGFDGEQIIDDLVSESFFQDCRQALSSEGIFVTNWWRADRRYPQFVQRLKKVFEQRVLEIPAQTHGNVAVLAFQAAPNTLSFNQLKKRAAKLSAQYHLDFQRMLADAKANNLHNDKQFQFE